VPKNFRIIDAGPCEVNGRWRKAFVRDAAWRRNLHVIWCLLALCCLIVACGGEERDAEKLYEQAQEHVRANDIDAAIATWQRVVQEYPTTKAASRARRDTTIYAGIDKAVRTYPTRMSQDVIISTARALQRYRDSRRRWPDSLDRLVPRYLPEKPLDPWGRDLLYEAKPRRRGYLLACLGADGDPGGEGKDADWFVEDGEFRRRPARSER
jgi:hypothetical protein